MADGTHEDVPVSYVFADSLVGSHDPLGSIEKGNTGFGAYPKLFRPRAAVVVLQKPVVFAENEKLHISIKHSASHDGCPGVYATEV